MIFSPNDFDLHLKHIDLVLSRLQKANLKLKLRKCHFAGSEAPFLGHIVSRNGLLMDPAKIDAVRKIRRPETKKDVRSFLGMAGYYRPFIKDFSIVAAPLHALTKAKASKEVNWTAECEKAFENLKDALTSYPVLRYPDFSRDFVLETDASKTGISAILMQDTPEGRVVIGYASRLLKGGEVNYGITELECLAVVWGVQHFRPYLFGRSFHVLTDHSSLTWLMNFKDPSGRLARWALTLQQYNFTIGYRPGSKNPVADALSRLMVLSGEVFPDDYDVEGLGSEFSNLCVFDQPRDNIYQVLELKREQNSDPRISNWIRFLRENHLSGDNKVDSETVMISRFLGFENGVLYHFWESVGDRRRKVLRQQVVIPATLRQRIMT